MLKRAISDFLFYCTVERKFSDNTIEAYHRDLIQFQRSVVTDDIHEALSINNLKQFLELMLNKKNLSISTAKRRLACLRAFTMFAAEREGLDDPFRSWSPKLKSPKRLPRALSTLEFGALIQNQRASSSIDGETIFCVLLLGATGLRVSELCNVTFDDIDPLGESIRVRGKGSRDRIVFVSHQSLRLELQRRRKASKHPRSPLFKNIHDRKLQPQTLRRRLHKLREACGLERVVTPHMLRHTAATLLIEGGTDIRLVQRLLGHASISTTEIYTHVNDVALKRAIMSANAIDRVIP